MKSIIPVLITAAYIALVSCTSALDRQLSEAITLAGDNRMELEKVISSYADEPQKLEAAKWLIANMPGHTMLWSEAIQTFADTLLLHPMEKAVGNALWDSLSEKSPLPQPIKDITNIKADFLMKDIDLAFRIWKNSSWHDEVSFNLFKNYVLPYRISSELIREGWRDSLYRLFSPVVKDAKSAKEAFQRLRKIVHARNQNWSYKFQYLIDPVAQNNYISGVCLERCIYLASICRAVGLPVTIDNIGKWANYSNSSHAWVSLILEDGVYTIIDDDSIPRKNNPIDASTFSIHQSLPEDYPYVPMLKKRYVKIWRNHFNYIPKTDIPIFSDIYDDCLKSPWLSDVSDQYGIDGELTIDVNNSADYVWLCIRTLHDNWIPAAGALVRDGKAHFENITDSVLLLPMCRVNNMTSRLAFPFFIDSEKNIKQFIPNKHELITATLNRKYPLMARWVNRYIRMRGLRVEGCNDPQFKHPNLLCQFNDILDFHNAVKFETPIKYRYIRLNLDNPKNLAISKVNILDKNNNIINTTSDNCLIDLGSSQEIGCIEIFPKNDGNFIEPGYDYELAYWDCNGWKTIGRKHSEEYTLTFDSIPSGALLILHNLTEGKEERPFSLQDGKQIWW